MYKVDVLEYWDRRYAQNGDSGMGSHMRESVKFKADYVNSCIDKFSIGSISEFGCGDGNQLMTFENFKVYRGYDISKVVIEKNKTLLDDPRLYFTSDRSDIISYECDMALSLDVIYHLVDDELYKSYMTDLFSTAPLVCIYSTNRDNVTNCPHMTHRDISTFVATHFKNYKCIDVSLFDHPTAENQLGFYLFQRNPVI